MGHESIPATYGQRQELLAHSRALCEHLAQGHCSQSVLPLLADVLRPALPQHLRGLVTRLQYCDADGEYPLLSQTSVTSQVRQHINQPMKQTTVQLSIYGVHF